MPSRAAATRCFRTGIERPSGGGTGGTGARTMVPKSETLLQSAARVTMVSGLPRSLRHAAYPIPTDCSKRRVWTGPSMSRGRLRPVAARSRRTVGPETPIPRPDRPPTVAAGGGAHIALHDRRPSLASCDADVGTGLPTEHRLIARLRTRGVRIPRAPIAHARNSPVKTGRLPPHWRRTSESG